LRLVAAYFRLSESASQESRGRVEVRLASDSSNDRHRDAGDLDRDRRYTVGRALGVRSHLDDGGGNNYVHPGLQRFAAARESSAESTVVPAASAGRAAPAGRAAATAVTATLGGFQRERACRGPAAVKRVDTDMAPRDGLGATPTAVTRWRRLGRCAVIRRRSADSGRPMGSARTFRRASMSEPANSRPGIAAGKKTLELPHITTIRMPPIACRIVSPDMYPSTARMTPEIITPISPYYAPV
jgi:hypothetical protein